MRGVQKRAKKEKRISNMTANNLKLDLRRNGQVHSTRQVLKYLTTLKAPSQGFYGICIKMIGDKEKEWQLWVAKLVIFITSSDALDLTPPT
eukprot:scaffold6068_cov73-Cyclotella_meneghiniana.AAC.1